MTISDYSKLYMQHQDPRFQLHPTFLFALYRYMQTHRLKSTVNINLKKNKCLDGSVLKAKDILGPSSSNLVEYNGGYKILQQDRSSPSYWNKIKSELMAMIRQLGMPSLFLTFSAAETWWPELLISLYYEKYGKSLTFDDVAKMTWAEKVGLIRENPVTTARHFDHRFRNYFNLVVKPISG